MEEATLLGRLGDVLAGGESCRCRSQPAPGQAAGDRGLLTLGAVQHFQADENNVNASREPRGTPRALSALTQGPPDAASHVSTRSLFLSALDRSGTVRLRGAQRRPGLWAAVWEHPSPSPLPCTRPTEQRGEAPFLLLSLWTSGSARGLRALSLAAGLPRRVALRGDASPPGEQKTH